MKYHLCKCLIFLSSSIQHPFSKLTSFTISLPLPDKEKSGVGNRPDICFMC